MVAMPILGMIRTLVVCTAICDEDRHKILRLGLFGLEPLRMNLLVLKRLSTLWVWGNLWVLCRDLHMLAKA
jgi:hypothetical protein